jgi:predicted alpha/beta superfamily hydrolase
MAAWGPAQVCGAILVIGALSVSGAAPQVDTVVVELHVVVPGDTPGNAIVYIAGNQRVAGNWEPDVVKLVRLDDERWHIKLELPKGGTLEYKFTLGSWSQVEKGANGEEIANRTEVLDSDKQIEATIKSWAKGGGQGTAGENREHTLTGSFKFHTAFESKHLALRRDVIVYLPAGYDAPANAQRRYAVLYMHDGQNLFDAATSFAGVEWRADETAGELIRAGKIEPIIIVGICNTSARMSEYTYGVTPRPEGKSGEDYLQFMVEELKSFIDSTYRTQPDRKHTAVAGSSLGGLISLYMASTRPDVFSMAGVVSPSLFWNGGRAVRDVADWAPRIKDVKFWVDMGTLEGRRSPGEQTSSTVTYCRNLIEAFQKAGLVESRNYKYLEVPDGQHNEHFWSLRLDQMLVYFFGQDTGDGAQSAARRFAR